MLAVKSSKRICCITLAVSCCLIANSAFAHALSENIEKLPASQIGWTYVKFGFTHILPLGYDHVLFIVGLFFLSPKLKSVMWQASIFTVAHSITLGLSMYKIIQPPAYLIEPIIALSIALIAAENLVTDQLKWWRALVIFGFGLIHGCGFAGVLSELGLPRNHIFTALLSFNFGVELGQLAVILIAYFLVGRWFGQKDWYRRRIIFPVSTLIAIIALYWTIERAFL